MEIKVPYGQKEGLVVTVDDDRVAGIIHSHPTASVDSRTIIEKALQEPIGAPAVDRFLQGARDILVLVNDATRPTPTAQVLETLVPRLKDLSFHFLVAAGSHREPTTDEYRYIFGRFYEEFKDRIAVHNARRRENMVVVGTTSRGTHMAVNRQALEADKMIIIGSVEPHYFAGFTGGRKSFLPGIAAFETIEHNHAFALQPQAHTLALAGNPVHEDMLEAAALLLKQKDAFAIMTIVNSQGDIQACTAGDLLACFLPATEKAKEVFVVPIPEKAEVVVTVAPYPSDINLFQSQKALENGKLALKDKGILILVSACRAGLGDETFAQLLGASDSPRDALQQIKKGYKLGYHKAAKIAEISLWAQIWAVTGLPDDQLKCLFIQPFADLQTALDRALKAQGSRAKILFLMEGSLTVPWAQTQ
jgi:nickel-dependent lactate racemase